MVSLSWIAALALAASGAEPAVRDPPDCTGATQAPVTAELQATLSRQSAALAEAWRSGDVAARMRMYTDDAVLLADHQPRLYGREAIARYYRALAGLGPPTALEQAPVEWLALGDDIFERGRFHETSTNGERRAGRYMRLWRAQPDGRYRLRVDGWGYAAPLADPHRYRFNIASTGHPVAPRDDPRIAAELDALNAAEAHSVRTHSLDRIALFADDAVFIPYAEPAKEGLAAIRPYLTGYIEHGRGATFDSVRTWNEGFERRGRYVLEYGRFEVQWRAGADGGTVRGAGLRVWRREADCSLRSVRQFGTHD